MRTFRPYEPDQPFLLPHNLRDWLPEDHLALFVSDVVDQLDLSAILDVYDKGDGRGQPPYHPAMMVKLVVYAYCTGMPSSRRIERATWENVAYRVLAANQHPDHDSIAAFRQRHLAALGGLFQQVLHLCAEAGLVQLGQMAIDGTKVQANASKHKAMSYQRMGETEQRLEQEIAALLAQAEAVDQAEDAHLGKGLCAAALPQELQRRESRLAKLREAKAALEAEARAKATERAEQAQEKLAVRERTEAETGKKPPGRQPVVPDPEQAVPDPKAQRNFTDPESRIMKDGASGSFVQAYNAQVAVAGPAQIIAATAVTQAANDKRQLIPMVRKVRENLGRLPERTLADAGYFSAAALQDPALAGTQLYVPPDRPQHGAVLPPPSPPPAVDGSVADEMRALLRTVEGQAIYKLRKAIVEPVFGQIKEVRGFRRFSFRGLVKVTAEWDLICLTHNLLKLFRSRCQPVVAATG